VWLATSAACDLIIAGYMTYWVRGFIRWRVYLNRMKLIKHDVEFRQTHAMISKLIGLIVGTGSLTGSYASSYPQRYTLTAILQL
jgi:hypothetical protein